MAFSTFYINAPTLASATAVFSNATLTVLAADGYYSDGAIVRRQLGGVLLAPELCPQCDTTCPQTITINNTGEGLYKMSVDVTTAIGPVLIRVDVSSLSDGFIAYWNGTPYNQLSSKNWGYVNNITGTPSPIDHAVWFGDSTDTGCIRAGVAAAVPVPCPPGGVGNCVISETQTTYNYDWGASTFIATGTSDWGEIYASEVQQQASVPGKATCVIPKTLAGPSNVDVWIYGFCSNTGWSVEVDCPLNLTSITTTGTSVVSDVAACADGTAGTLYNAPVNGSAGVPGLYDWIYTDAAATTLLSPGADTWYKYVDGGINKWFKVSTDSVITDMNTC
jgi:hypothetical protein